MMLNEMLEEAVCPKNLERRISEKGHLSQHMKLREPECCLADLFDQLILEEPTFGAQLDIEDPASLMKWSLTASCASEDAATGRYPGWPSRNASDEQSATRAGAGAAETLSELNESNESNEGDLALFPLPRESQDAARKRQEAFEARMKQRYARDLRRNAR